MEAVISKNFLCTRQKGSLQTRAVRREHGMRFGGYCYKAVYSQKAETVKIGYNITVFSGYPILTLGKSLSFASPFQSRSKKQFGSSQCKKNKLSFVCLPIIGAVCSGSLQGQPLSVLDFNNLYGNIHSVMFLGIVLNQKQLKCL